MMKQISDVSNLSRACQRVISNGGRGGVDGMEVTDLRAWFSENYKVLQEQLLSGEYYPEAVRGVKIPKPKGGYRQLGIPTVIDRLVQQSILQVLSPRYEQVFSEYSYGFRPGRSAHQALKQAGEYVAQGKRHIVDIDLAKFFDEVNHSRLLWLLSKRIGDRRVLQLLHRYLKSGMLEGGLRSQRIKGTPQGGPLSPLLSNIVLDELDKELERRGHNFVRYADDLIVLVGSEAASERVLKSLVNYIEGDLSLRVNQEKSRRVKNRELNFLGHGISSDGSLLLSKSSESRLKSKLKRLTHRNAGKSFGSIVKSVNRLLTGWLHYFKHAKMKTRLQKLGSWLRHRLRCYRLKQCKRALGMYRLLRKLGVPNTRSWTTAASRKGWWRKAATPAAHEGMDKLWFAKVGLVDMVSVYTGLHT
jgi:RNA-directed DNA polymerase